MIHDLIIRILKAELGYLQADWWILSTAILIAVGVKVYLGQERIKQWVQGKATFSISGTVGFGAFTPLCSCGTMAVILSMFVTSLPWGPVMAFLVSSPLTSPSQFALQSGILGLDIAVTILISSLVMGFGVGFLSILLERHTSFFNDQYRAKLRQNMGESCDYSGKKCSKDNTKRDKNNCCDSEVKIKPGKTDNWIKRWKIKELLKGVYELGFKKVLLFFMIFVALGQIIEFFVPTEWILQLFSPGKIYSVPLAAVIGLPLYVSGSASIPLLETFLQAGAGKGSVIAFLIAGQGTSMAVIVGISTFLKKRVIIYYITFMLAGAILSGFVFHWLFI